MALVRETLKQEIKGILNDLKDEENQEAAIEAYADRLSLAIDTYIKSATVVITSAVTADGMAVTGTATIQ